MSATFPDSYGPLTSDDPQVWSDPRQAVAVAKIDATEVAHRQFGQVRTDLDVMAEDLERLFARMVKAKDVLLERGVRAEYVLSAPLEAAFKAWELNKVGEAPLGPPLA